MAVVYERKNEAQDIRFFKVEEDDVGYVEISGEVRSESRPNLFHKVTIQIDDYGYIKPKCDCEAGSNGYLCRHVVRLYNHYIRNKSDIMLERARQSVAEFG